MFAFLNKMKEEDRADAVKVFEEAKRYSKGAEGEYSIPPTDPNENTYVKRNGGKSG